jgi:hypothetical protein
VDPNLVPACKLANVRISPRVRDLHDAEWWAEKLEDFDFHDADRADEDEYNRVLWEGTMGDVPYPSVRSGLDLRKNRAQLLKKWKAALSARQKRSSDPAIE